MNKDVQLDIKHGLHQKAWAWDHQNLKIFIGAKCKGWLVLSSNPIKWPWMKTCWNPTWIIANNIGQALRVFF
jgi:hypothetical protein